LSYTRTLDDFGWGFSMDLASDHLVAWLIRGSEVHELVTHCATMLRLPEKGYQLLVIVPKSMSYALLSWIRVQVFY
jgi:hypothetical protein